MLGCSIDSDPLIFRKVSACKKKEYYEGAGIRVEDYWTLKRNVEVQN